MNFRKARKKITTSKNSKEERKPASSLPANMYMRKGSQLPLLGPPNKGPHWVLEKGPKFCWFELGGRSLISDT